MYTTHSPLLVDLERFQQIVHLTKVSRKANEPQQTRTRRASYRDVVRVIEDAMGADEGEYDVEGMLARMHTLLTPWTNEGFFSDVAVLVEGEDDRSMLIGASNALEHDLESMDIAIIPCRGKNNIGKLAAILKVLEVPTYLIWDSDKEAIEKARSVQERENMINDNKALLRLCKCELEDYPSRIKQNYACFENNLDTTMKQEMIPEFYNGMLIELKEEFSYKKLAQAKKNPRIIKILFEEAFKQGKEMPTFKAIIRQIVDLRNSLRN